MKSPLDLDANAYAIYATNQLAGGKEMLEELKFQGHGWVLDIGCGPGILTALIAQKIPKGHVIGIDASFAMIAYAKKQRLPNASFMVLDATSLDFAERFDLVFSNAVFHWIEAQKDLLQGIVRALKPQGLLRAQFMGRQSTIMRQVLAELQYSKPYKPYLQNFIWPKTQMSKAAYENLLKEVGKFQTFEVWEKETERTFENEEHLKGWIASMYYKIYAAPLPEALREPFFNDLIQKVLQGAIKQENGKISLGPGTRLHVRAQKAPIKVNG